MRYEDCRFAHGFSVTKRTSTLQMLDSNHARTWRTGARAGARVLNPIVRTCKQLLEVVEELLWLKSAEECGVTSCAVCAECADECWCARWWARPRWSGSGPRRAPVRGGGARWMRLFLSIIPLPPAPCFLDYRPPLDPALDPGRAGRAGPGDHCRPDGLRCFTDYTC